MTRKRKKDYRPRRQRDTDSDEPSERSDRRSKPTGTTQRRTGSSYGIPGILSTSLKSALPGPKITSWDDVDYLHVRNAQLQLCTSNGKSNRLSMIDKAFTQAASYDLVKDWDATQRAALQTLFLYDWYLVNELTMQANLRKLLPDYVANYGVDTSGLWSEDGWQSLMQELKANPVPLLPGVVELVRMLQPIVQTQPGLAERGFPPAFTLFWTPTLPLADVRTDIITEIRSNIHGLIHLKKIGFNSTMFNPEIVNEISPVISPNVSSIWAFFFREMAVHYQPAAGDVVTNQNQFYPQSDVYGGNIASTVYYYNPTEGPYPGYGLLHIINRYHATNNPMGCLRYEDNPLPKSGGTIAIADEEIGVLRCKFLGDTELDHISYANAANCVSDFGVLTQSSAGQSTGATTGLAHDVGHDGIMSKMFRKTTASSVWAEAENNTIAQLLGVAHGI